jgi:hypothetical protein
MAAPAIEVKENGPRQSLGPGAQGATAPRPAAAAVAPVHGAKAKPPDGGAGD